MRRLLQIVSFAALVGTLGPALLYFSDAMTLSALKLWMLTASVVWFAVTPLWMGRGRRV
jgi:hypothetical protein